MIKNLIEGFNTINAYWAPQIVADVNDSYVKIAKGIGEFVWHTHDDEDELFLIVKGSLTIQYENNTVVLKENDVHVVPKGVKHCPLAEDEVWFMLLENKTTKHTGNTVSDLTKSVEDQKA